MTHSKTVLIIGAGVAGLAAGCYARMNGYDARIVEPHKLPGGLCTAWTRGGFTFDGCLHYLFGTAPGGPYYRLWEELGALPGRGVVNHRELLRVTDDSGRTLVVHCDPDRLEAHLLELSRADAPRVRALAGGVRVFGAFDFSALQERPRDLMGLAEWRALGQKMSPLLGAQLRWGRHSAASFARTFRDPFLWRAVAEMFGWSEVPLTAGMSLLASMHAKNAGFPAGGSLAFARALERRFLGLGGGVRYGSRVEQILVDNDRAVGVRLYGGEELRADYVISAADGRTTHYGLLDGRYLNRGLRRRYDGHLPLRPQVQVSLGVNRDLTNEPHWTTHLLPEPLTLGGTAQGALGVKHYAFDPALAPPGKASVIVSLPADYEYWRRIYGHRLYDEAQERLADALLGWLEGRYPGLTAQVEVYDVATPMSYEFFTGDWQGSTCGFLLTPETMLGTIGGLRQTVPGLKNFVTAGQWVQPGGSVPASAMSGRNAVKLLCAFDKKPFRITVPEHAPEHVSGPPDSGASARCGEEGLERQPRVVPPEAHLA